ncbi:MAG: hypothetical protein ABJN62_08765 [Halioglobus sp.]
MKTPIYQWIGQMLAAGGVILSLALVAYELKQSRDIAIAEVYQARSAIWVDYAVSLYSPEQYESAVVKLDDPSQTLTAFDNEVMDNVASVTFTYFENLHFQYQQGLITEEEWISTKENIVGEFEYRCIYQWWQEYGNAFRESFVREINEVTQGMEFPACEDPSF